MGVFCYIGINEYGEEIIEFIKPEIKLDLFYYSCSKKFETSLLSKYIGNNISGVIIFANGNDCLGYQFENGDFVKIFTLNGNLIKRHKNGGSSSNRYARIAEESRHVYGTRICDRLEKLKTKNNWIFGSDEIVQMVLKRSPIKLNNGGFLDFNTSTISNKKFWIEYLIKKENYDEKYKEILYYLETNPDILDFDPKNQNMMKYFMINASSKKFNTGININTHTNEKQIHLEITSKYYSQLCMFEYIGVKYYNYQIDTEDFENIEYSENIENSENIEDSENKTETNIDEYFKF